MFGASQHICRVGEGVTLQAFDAGCRNQRGKPWRLAGAFHHTPPARITRHIQHRRVNPVHTGCCRFTGCRAFGLFDERHIKTCGLCQRGGKNSAVAMQYIKAQQQRNFQTAVGKGQLLQIMRVGCAVNIEKAANRAFLDGAFNIGGGIRAGDRIMARQ